MADKTEETQVAGEQTEKKVYPGNHARYAALRGARVEVEANYGPTATETLIACVAEELAGIAYILDGIRYRAGQR